MIAFWHKHENISEVILSHVFLNRKTTVLCNNGGIIRPRHHVFVKNNCMGTQSIHNNCCGIKREREKMRCFSLAFRWCCMCRKFSCGEYESSSSATKYSLVSYTPFSSHTNRLYGHLISFNRVENVFVCNQTKEENL